MTEPKPTVLLVDDDQDMLRLLSIRMESEGFTVQTATSGSEALNKVRASLPDVVVTDLKMPGIDGMELLDSLHRERPTLPVLIITAHGTIPDAVAATRKGALGFITKPVDKAELVEQLRAATVGFDGTEVVSDDNIITRSSEMKAVMEKARRAAKAAIPVLLQGESGTGKELLARYVHDASDRAGEFVAVNCSAIPDTLLESELFGHEKGAFTGADDRHEGLVTTANGGTLFLDEIGDMPLAVQAKLLRTLQERRVRPVGAKTEHEVDILVVSATHRDLENMMAHGTFRGDLLYRLNVLGLDLPPLRERPEDIPLLVQQFMREVEVEGEPRVISPEAMEVLVGQPWPGNVRQLGNIVQRAVALSSTEVISAAQIKDALGDKAMQLPSFDEAREEFTRSYLVQLLKVSGGNVSRAARLADRNRTDFHKLLKKHDIDSGDFKNPSVSD